MSKTNFEDRERFIYITTNLINNKKYIGQHIGYSQDNYLGSGVELIKAIKKYGRENFRREILCFCSTQEEMDEKEMYYIKKYNAVKNPNFYNISEGGKGGSKTAGLSEEQEQERRNKISKALKGRPSYLSYNYTPEKHPLYGKHHSEEAKEKMRQAKLGKNLSEEHKKKIGKSVYNRRVIAYDKDMNEVQHFNNLREANIFLGLSPKSTYRLREAMKQNKYYHGYLFKDEVEEPVSTILGSEE